MAFKMSTCLLEWLAVGSPSRPLPAVLILIKKEIDPYNDGIPTGFKFASFISGILNISYIQNHSAVYRKTILLNSEPVLFFVHSISGGGCRTGPNQDQGPTIVSGCSNIS